MGKWLKSDFILKAKGSLHGSLRWKATSSYLFYGKITVGWSMHHPLGEACLEAEGQEDSEEAAAVVQADGCGLDGFRNGQILEIFWN